MSLGDSLCGDPSEKLMDEGFVRVIEGFSSEVGILGTLVFRFERRRQRRFVLEHRLHLGKRLRQPTLEGGEALSVTLHCGPSPIPSTRRRSISRRREDLWQATLAGPPSTPLALRHGFLFAGLHIGDGTAVLGGHAFPFAVVLLEQRGQTMLIGRRVREL
jgi:hypothetical protein